MKSEILPFSKSTMFSKIYISWENKKRFLKIKMKKKNKSLQCRWRSETKSSMHRQKMNARGALFIQNHIAWKDRNTHESLVDIQKSEL